MSSAKKNTMFGFSCFCWEPEHPDRAAAADPAPSASLNILFIQIEYASLINNGGAWTGASMK
jgi:hypothetical protein